MNVNKSPILRRTGLLLVAVLFAGLFTAGAVWYRAWASKQLPVMAENIGEVWMAQAVRSERAGALEQAREQYERALSGTFHGAENRNHCQKHLGMVLSALGRYEEALPHLQSAQQSLHRSINGYAPLVAALVALGRQEEAEAALRMWQSAAALTEEGFAPGLPVPPDAAEGSEEAREALEAHLRTAYPDANTAANWARLDAWTE